MGKYLPSTGPGAITVRPPSLRICDRNGSGVQTASTWPFASADRMAGKGTARSLIELASMPDFLSAARIITSPTPFSALTAIVLPQGRPATGSCSSP